MFSTLLTLTGILLHYAIVLFTYEKTKKILFNTQEIDSRLLETQEKYIETLENRILSLQQKLGN